MSNNEYKRFKELQDAIVGMDMQLDMHEQNLNTMENSLKNLKSAEKVFKFNIKILKREKVIAMASEYKKSVQELNQIQRQIIKLENSIYSTVLKIKDIKKNYEHYSAEYEGIKNTVESDKTVYLDDYRKKRAK